MCRNFGANYVNTYQQMGEPTTHHTRHDVLALLSHYVGYNRHDYCVYVIILLLLEQLIADGIKEELMNLCAKFYCGGDRGGRGVPVTAGTAVTRIAVRKRR